MAPHMATTSRTGNPLPFRVRGLTDGWSLRVCSPTAPTSPPKSSILLASPLIIALSARSKTQALDLTKHYHLTVEYWPIIDPTSLGGDTREAKMAAYRQVRDQIRDKLIERFGPPTA